VFYIVFRIFAVVLMSIFLKNHYFYIRLQVKILIYVQNLVQKYK